MAYQFHDQRGRWKLSSLQDRRRDMGCSYRNIFHQIKYNRTGWYQDYSSWSPSRGFNHHQLLQYSWSPLVTIGCLWGVSLEVPRKRCQVSKDYGEKMTFQVFIGPQQAPWWGPWEDPWYQTPSNNLWSLRRGKERGDPEETHVRQANCYSYYWKLYSCNSRSV